MKEQLKMLAISFSLIFVAQFFLKSIGQYNSVSFIVGGLVYAIYYAIVEMNKNNISKKQILTDFEKFKIIEEKDEK